MNQHATARARLYHGWWVVAASFAVMLVGFGSAYTFSTFLASFQREFAASRGSVSVVFSLAGFLYFGLGVVSGPLADRWGARRLAVIGMLVLAAGLALASLARSLFEVYAAYGAGVGIGIGCSYVPAVAAVQRWFVRRRGIASGIAVSGIGVGTLVMPPLASRLIDQIGWRQTYLVLAAIAVIAGAGMALLIEQDPRARGLGPDGEPLAPEAASRPLPGIALGAAIRTRRFIAMYLACLIGAFGVFVPFVHLVPYATAHGIEPTTAALLVGAIGIGSTAGRFFLGGIADRIGRQRALVVMFLGIGLALVVWLMSTGFAALAGFALIYGAFYGGFVAILPALMADSFGARNLSGVIGVLYTSVAFGTLIGPAAAGFAYDISHSYTLPILAGAGTSLAAAAILARLPGPPPP